MRYPRKSVTISIKGFPITCEMWNDHLLDTCEQFTKTRAGLRAATRIAAAVRSVEPGKRYELSDEDWSLLSAAVERPTQGYLALSFVNGKTGEVKSGEIGRFCLQMADDVADAPPTMPVEDRS